MPCLVDLSSIFRYLVEGKGASVDLRNNNRKTPLHDAAQFSQYEVVEYLINRGTFSCMNLTQQNHQFLTNLNLIIGADVNALKNTDWTPLMLACTKLRADVVSILLKHGADPLFRNKDGWNSFYIASREGSVEILQLLVSQLTDPTVERIDRLVNSSSNNGRKPLHTAGKLFFIFSSFYKNF